jgi:hypothetical protein
LFLTRSLSAEDIDLLQAAMGKLPRSWERPVRLTFTWLVKSFYRNP